MAVETQVAPPREGASDAGPRRNPVAFLSPRKIGAVYIWIVIIIVFGMIAHGSFMNTSTISTVRSV